MYSISYSSRQPDQANKGGAKKDYYSSVDALLSELMGFSTLKPVERTNQTNYTIKEDSEEALTLEFTVPGIDPKEIKVSFKGKELTVDTPKGSFRWSSPNRQLSPNGATAVAKHGILTVRLPKQSETNYEISVSAE